MTGFGSARGRVGEGELFLEVRAVNHRYLEVNGRLPHRLAPLEGEVAKLIRGRFARGKFDFFVREGERDRQEIALVRQSYQLLKEIKRSLKLSGEITLSDLLSFRQIYFAGYGRDSLDKLKPSFLRLVEQALKKLAGMRKREGNHLKKWFRLRLRHLEKLLTSLEKETKNQEETLRRAGEESGELLEEGPRFDVTEEVVRLKSHLKEFRRIVEGGGVIGRKLDFLSQEMVREINTIGSKSQGVKVSHQVVDFKSDLEKLREQVQNIE